MIASAEKIFNSVAIPASGEITPDKDISIIITSNNSTLTLNSGAFPGIEVSLTVLANASITYDGVNGVSCTDVVSANKKMTYIYTGSAWFCSSCPVAIGDVYTQYPDTLAPGLLYGGQWEAHNYGGMFFRSEGGNAHTFVPELVGTFSNNKTFTANEAFTGVAVNDLVVVDGQYDTVAAISGNVITLTTGLTNWSTKTKVLIGQAQTVLLHKHTFSGNAISGSVYVTSEDYPISSSGQQTATGCLSFVRRSSKTYYNTTSQSTAYTRNFGINFSATPSGTISNTGSSEARSNNISLKTWLRIS